MTKPDSVSAGEHTTLVGKLGPLPKATSFGALFWASVNSAVKLLSLPTFPGPMTDVDRAAFFQVQLPWVTTHTHTHTRAVLTCGPPSSRYNSADQEMAHWELLYILLGQALWKQSWQYLGELKIHTPVIQQTDSWFTLEKVTYPCTSTKVFLAELFLAA